MKTRSHMTNEQLVNSSYLKYNIDDFQAHGLHRNKMYYLICLFRSGVAKINVVAHFVFVPFSSNHRLFGI